MNSNEQSTNQRKKYFEWVWEFNSCNPSETEQWNLYSDIETEVSEEAFRKSQCSVPIDGYSIDLKRALLISKINENDRRPIKRTLQNIEQDQNDRERKIRLNRFQPIDSINWTTKKAFTDTEYEYDFIAEVRNYFKLHGYTFGDSPILQMVVEKAAEGLIFEGRKIGKENEAQWMAQQLQHVKDSSAEDIWNCCAYLYTKDSFLYQKINEIMRSVANGDENDEEIWKSKIPTFGPFVWLLDSLRKKEGVDTTITVYRGSTLSEDLIKQFQHVEQNVLCRFPAFISVTTDPAVADMYGGNAIFYFNVCPEDGNDISSLSQFPDEKEILIAPSFLFTIKSCAQINNKWNIHLASFIAEFSSMSVSENSVDSTHSSVHSFEISDDSSATSVNSFDIFADDGGAQTIPST